MVHSLNLAAVTAAAKQMSANLMAYYTKSGASNQGVINPSSAKDATGFVREAVRLILAMVRRWNYVGCHDVNQLLIVGNT